MPASGDQLFKAGVVIGTHGLRGDLKVRPVNTGSTGLENATRVVLRSADGSEAGFEPVRVVPYKGGYLLRLRGRERIEQVEGLVGDEVWMPLDDLGDLPAGENYWHQLEGLEVVDARLGSLGTLDQLFTTAAHDIYVVNGPYGEVLIPAVETFVVEIDLERRRMDVALPDGLVSTNDDL